MGLETRLISTAIELRESADGPVLVGSAILYNRESVNLGGFVETIASGAFADDIKSDNEVMALAHHDNSQILGRRSAGTLTLNDSKASLDFELPLADTTAGKDMAIHVKRGDIAGMSFGFRTVKDTWTEPEEGSNEPVRREVLEGRLHHIAPVADPAYPDTNVGIRNALPEDAAETLRAMLAGKTVNPLAIAARHRHALAS